MFQVMTETILLFFVFTCSVLMTGVIRSYAIQKQLIDNPNERSSHTIATPRGGGVSIVIIFSIILLILYLLNQIELNYFTALFVGGLLVGTIGFLDDHRHIPAGWRMSVHFLAALWAIYWLGDNSIINLSEGILHHGLYIDLVALFMIVWFLNLYNFMDGIDGIAGIEAITTAGAAAFILILTSPVSGQHQNYVLTLLILAVAVLGFLVWNWPPAKIFMGDVGSGYLGYLFALFIIDTAIDTMMTVWVWFILLGVFIVDATLTLLRRIVDGKRWYEAHRNHAYQHAAQRWNSHRKITLSVLSINIFWLFPLGWLAAIKPEWGASLTAGAYMPIIILAFYLHAGKSQ
jgi:Fuc2NAc and GlcNAc transferase